MTGIRYRLLPMTRAVLAELFTPAEARRHLDIVARELRFADGVRLMSEPSAYRGGRERLFKRADTAANVGREIGLEYLHAHLRYAEAMAKVGDAHALWWALQVANPVGLSEVVPGAAPRQSKFLRAVRGCLLGVRESFDDVVFDPVLPSSRDGLVARLRLRGRPVEVRYRVRERGFGPAGLVVNRARLPAATLESIRTASAASACRRRACQRS
jgi:CRISPR-associated protein Csx3